MGLSVKRNLSVVETRLAGQNPELEFTLVIYCFLRFVCFVASKCELSIKQRGNAVEVPHH